LGDTKPQEAKSYFLVAMAMDQLVTCGTVGCIFLGRHAIPALYTNDATVVAMFEHVAFIVALFHWGDSTQFVLQGVFRGAGKQQPAAKAVLLSLWLVGVPMCWYLGVFHELGAPGILLGLMIGFCVEVPLLLRDLIKWDWVEMAEEAALSLEEVAHGEYPHHEVPPHGSDEPKSQQEPQELTTVSVGVMGKGDEDEVDGSDEHTHLRADA
jgi:Na+-driven multidrug efflux pump